MTNRKCGRCGATLSSDNPGVFCSPCQKKRFEEKYGTTDNIHYTADDLAGILGLQSEEQVRRLARQGKLPPRIPGIRRYLWLKGTIDIWIHSGLISTAVNNELYEAISIANMLGWPVDRMTSQGYDPDYLITRVREYKHLLENHPDTKKDNPS